MNYESFFDGIRGDSLELRFDNSADSATQRLSNEALFHLPLLAVTILMLSKDRRKPKVDRIGQVVGECFERTFPDFKGSSQHLGWSANLRVRTVRALTFLEIANLVEIDKRRNQISSTALGKRVIAAALKGDSDLSFTLRLIERSYRNISVERQLAIDLE